MTWYVIRQGKEIATVTADTKRDAQVIVRDRFGDGPWLLPR